MGRKCIIWSDLHAGYYRSFAPATVRGLTTRVEDVLGVMDQIIAYLTNLSSQTHCPVSVFLGDLFERKGLIEVPLYSEVAKRMDRIADLSESDCIVGNHDIANEFWSVLDGFWCPGRVGVHSVPRSKLWGPEGKVEGIFLPYTKTPQASVEAAREMMLRTPNCKHVVFIHNGLSGAVTGPVSYSPDEEIGEDSFAGADRVFFGHYHKPQTLPGGAMCVGSGIQQDFGEAGEQKRFLVLDLDTLEVESVPLHSKPLVNVTLNSIKDLEKLSLSVDGYVKVRCTTNEIKEEEIAQRIQATNIVFSYDVQPTMVTERMETPSLESPEKLLEQFVDMTQSNSARSAVFAKYGREEVLRAGLDIVHRMTT